MRGTSLRIKAARFRTSILRSGFPRNDPSRKIRELVREVSQESERSTLRRLELRDEGLIRRSLPEQLVKRVDSAGALVLVSL